MRHYGYNVAFRRLHPSPTAGRKQRGVDMAGSDLVTDGRESKYVSCRQCGFSGCNVERDNYHYHTGYGQLPVETVTVLGNSIIIESNRAGCPFCKSEAFI